MTAHLPRLLAPHRRRLLLAAGAAVAAELSAAALTGTAAWLVARAAEQPPLSAVAVAVVAVRALALGRGLLRYLDRLLGHDVALAAVSGQRTRVYEALVPLAPDAVTAFRSGDLLTRLVEDVDAVRDLLLRCLVPAVVAVGVAVTATGFSAASHGPAGAVLAAGLAVAGVGVPCAVFASARRASRENDVRGALAARTTDLLHGAAELTAFNATGPALAAARELGAELTRIEHRGARTAGVATAAILLVQGTTTIAVALSAFAAELSPITTTVLVVLALTAFDVVAPLPAAARRLVAVRASARRLTSVLAARPPTAEPPHPAAPGGHGLEIRDLRVPGRLDGPVNLRVAPGRRVALVGPSGSGKSTLLAVLMRFVDYEGSVTIGGRELRSLRGDDVRRLVTGMTQDAHVFHASVRENLVLARPGATPAELRAAARQARLLDWIESLPNGWETPVGSGGVSMSGGQRQRLLLARALLADPPVLVLDEPTEGLDQDTAEELLADILATTHDRTTLLVTHSPAAQAAADQVHIVGAGSSSGPTTPPGRAPR